MEYVDDFGDLDSNVMFEPGLIEWSLQGYEREIDVEEFDEGIVPRVEPIESIEDVVMYEPDGVEVSVQDGECYPDSDYSLHDDPEADNEEVDSSSGCGIMCAEYLEDLLVYEDVESKDSVEGGLDFEAEPDSSSDEASSQVNTANEIFNEGRPRRGRKRKIPSQSRADRKRLLNTNKTHINTKGNEYTEKLFDYQFECSCLKNCTQVIPVHERLRLFSQFWNVGTYDGRCAYLMSCVKEVDKKRSYSENHLKNREKSRIYSIYGTIVCQKTLLKTLQISVSRVKVALGKYMNLDTLADLRGKSIGGWNALPPSKKAEVCAHIASFPRYMSHYTRAKTDSKYLSADLNLAKIYHLYRQDAENPVSQSTYNDIFTKKFNLRFKRPKKDTCYKCDQFALKRQTQFGDDLKILEEWHESHLEQAELLQAQMKSDLKDAANDPELECLTFDLQKTLPLPKITTGIAYYKRQLNLYNFGVHSGSTGKGFFNIWTEDQASKGTQEVGSCLKAHIAKITKPIKKLILWSDSCGGQNRSIKLVLMMMHVLQNHKTLESISIRYLLSGHSFLPNDTEFGEAETALKSYENLYTDEAYIQVMKECRRKNKFTVNRMSPDDFFSVQSLEALITNRKVDIQNRKVSWLDTHEISIEKGHPSVIKMRNKISGPFQIVNLAKLGCELKMEDVVLRNLWPTGRPLSKEKIKDLTDLLVLVPEEHRYFYELLTRCQGADFEDDIDGYGMSIDFDPEPEWTS